MSTLAHQLMGDISEQLRLHQQTLSSALDLVDGYLENGDELPESLEEDVQTAAAGIVGAIGALRALAEVANADDAGDDGDDNITG